VANLIVRNVDNAIVMALKVRAGQEGISAEAEHRKILERALLRPAKKSFADVLCTIPHVGIDSDFQREQDGNANDVFN
jgi:plasmid stability protein